MDADQASTEGELPDTVPAAFVAAHGRAARRTVARSARPTPSDPIAAWGVRLADAAMVVAAVGIVVAVVFLVIAFPVLGVPLAAVAVAVAAVALLAWVVRRRIQRG